MTDAFGAHSRNMCTPHDLMLALGTMVPDLTPADVGQHVLDTMPPEARAHVESVGLPAYRKCRARLHGH